MKGKTETGFSFNIDPDVLDDWETVKILRKIDKGETAMIVDAIERILGEELETKLETFIQKRDGKVSASAMTKEFVEILNSIKDGKN